MTFSDKLTLASLIVTLLGFGIAIWQLVRAANAAEATQAAVERTEHRMALNHLLVVLPQIRILEQDLDRAVEDDDRLAAMRALGAYSYVVSEVSGLLAEQDVMDASMVDRLQDSAVAASRAKGKLLDNPTMLAKSATREFRQGLGEIATALNSLVGRYRLQAQPRK